MGVPSLEYKEEGGCWKPAPTKSGPTNRGQRKRWRLDLPAPCKTYKFRFALQSDSCVDYLENPKMMGGSPQYLVDQSRFLPGAPQNLQMGGNNTLEWDAVPCASEYQVTYSTEDGQTTTLVSEDAPSNTQLPFAINPCQNVNDDVTLDASFLFGDFQEVCPAPSLPRCKAAPLPSPPEASLSLKENEESVVAKELPSQFPTLLICLVAGGLLLFLVVVTIATIVIRRRQWSGVHHVQKS